MNESPFQKYWGDCGLKAFFSDMGGGFDPEETHASAWNAAIDEALKVCWDTGLIGKDGKLSKEIKKLKED